MSEKRVAVENKIQKIKRRLFFKSFIYQDVEKELFLYAVESVIQKIEVLIKTNVFSLSKAQNRLKEYEQQLKNQLPYFIKNPIADKKSDVYGNFIRFNYQFIPDSFNIILDKIDEFNIEKWGRIYVREIYENHFFDIIEKEIKYSINTYEGKYGVDRIIKEKYKQSIMNDEFCIDGYSFNINSYIFSCKNKRHIPGIYRPQENFDPSTYVKGTYIARVVFLNKDRDYIASKKLYYYIANEYIKPGECYYFGTDDYPLNFSGTGEVAVAVISNIFYKDGDEWPYDANKIKKGRFGNTVNFRGGFSEDGEAWSVADSLFEEIAFLRKQHKD